MAVVLACGWSALVSDARADTAADHSADGTIIWGVAGMELGGAAAMTYMFGGPSSPPSSGRALAAAAVPVVAGVGAALLAAKLDAGPRGGYAAHGALWGAVGAGAFGMAVDGARDASGVKAGRASAALALTGALVGGAVGALLPDDRVHPIYLGGPMVAAMGTLIIGGVAMVVAMPDRPGRVLALAAGGSVLGALAVGALAALAAPPVVIEPTRGARTREPTPLILSLGGRY